jgi:hypothetical protein
MPYFEVFGDRLLVHVSEDPMTKAIVELKGLLNASNPRRRGQDHSHLLSRGEVIAVGKEPKEPDEFVDQHEEPKHDLPGISPDSDLTRVRREITKTFQALSPIVNARQRTFPADFFQVGDVVVFESVLECGGYVGSMPDRPDVLLVPMHAVVGRYHPEQ